MAQPDFLRFIKDFAYRNGYSRRSRIYIEPKANGISTAQTLRRYTKLNIILDKAPTDDKPSRVNGILPFLEARRVYLLEGASWVEPFLYETGIFDKGKQDGQVDCLCIAADKVSNPKTRVKFHYYDLSKSYS
jgi:phage terminase large subunit-like protein